MVTKTEGLVLVLVCVGQSDSWADGPRQHGENSYGLDASQKSEVEASGGQEQGDQVDEDSVLGRDAVRVLFLRHMITRQVALGRWRRDGGVRGSCSGAVLQ